jgi:hypothetical protein
MKIDLVLQVFQSLLQSCHYNLLTARDCQVLDYSNHLNFVSIFGYSLLFQDLIRVTFAGFDKC